MGTRTNSRSALQRGQYRYFRFSLDAAAGRPLGAVSCNPHSGHSNVRSPKLYCGNPISITVLADDSIGRPPRYAASQMTRPSWRGSWPHLGNTEALPAKSASLPAFSWGGRYSRIEPPPAPPKPPQGYRRAHLRRKRRSAFRDLGTSSARTLGVV